MCEDMNSNGAAEVPAVAPSFVERELAQLRGAVEAIQRDLVELRMGQRKALLEELAALENPLVERGIIARRTRPPRHGEGRLPDGDGL